MSELTVAEAAITNATSRLRAAFQTMEEASTDVSAAELLPPLCALVALSRAVTPVVDNLAGRVAAASGDTVDIGDCRGALNRVLGGLDEVCEQLAFATASLSLHVARTCGTSALGGG